MHPVNTTNNRKEGAQFKRISRSETTQSNAKTFTKVIPYCPLQTDLRKDTDGPLWQQRGVLLSVRRSMEPVV